MDATSVTTENSSYRIKFQGTSGTSALTAGQYILWVFATSGNDRYTVLRHSITVEQNHATGTPTRSHAARMLEIIETAIYNRVNQTSGTASTTTEGGIEEYAIDGTSVSKMPMEQLQKLRARYANEVAREMNPNAPLGTVKFEFTKAGSVADLRRRYS